MKKKIHEWLSIWGLRVLIYCLGANYCYAQIDSSDNVQNGVLVDSSDLMHTWVLGKDSRPSNQNSLKFSDTLQLFKDGYGFLDKDLFVEMLTFESKKIKIRTHRFRYSSQREGYWRFNSKNQLEIIFERNKYKFRILSKLENRLVLKRL